MFIITNGKNYLTQTVRGITSTNKKGSAITFTSEEKANNFLRNTPRTIRQLGYYCKDTSKKVVEENIVVEKEVPTNTLEIVVEFEELLKKLSEEKDVAISGLDLEDAKIRDIQHAAEFFNLNASEGYKLYKMLHEARIQRRVWKDEIATIEYVLGSTMEDFISGRVSRRIDGLNNRKYRPRVFEELFNGRKE